jgi:L-fucose isomerase-like protein
VLACGINCLNESHFSDTTPCLAWNWLYQDIGLTWGCEGDTMAMLTHHILHQSLPAPIMMTNMYPFLLGQAALKHERIVAFPEVTQPENHLLVAHCGYLGVLPQFFATERKLRSKVLAIVDENVSAIDARLPEGPITLAKLHPRLDRLSVAEGSLDGYAQYPGSDCRNGGVIRLQDGHRFLKQIASHHYLLMTEHLRRDLEWVSAVFGFDLEVL